MNVVRKGLECLISSNFDRICSVQGALEKPRLGRSLHLVRVNAADILPIMLLLHVNFRSFNSACFFGSRLHLRALLTTASAGEMSSAADSQGCCPEPCQHNISCGLSCMCVQAESKVCSGVRGIALSCACWGSGYGGLQCQQEWSDYE